MIQRNYQLFCGSVVVQELLIVIVLEFAEGWDLGDKMTDQVRYSRHRKAGCVSGGRSLACSQGEEMWVS